MSFNKLKADELALLATEGFAVEIPEGATKPQIIAALAENTITWEQALESPFLPEKYRAVEPAPAVVTTETIAGATPTVTAVVEPPKEIVAKVVTPEKVLMKMERENPRYDIRGHKFTQDHPFALVDENDAEYIIENVEGFRYATPKEARDFYS